MVELIQLKDGSYKLVVKYKDETVSVDSTWYFKKSEPSDAEEEKVVFSFGVDRK